MDDEEVIRLTLATILTQHGFEVTTAGSVAEALQKITTEKFDVLLSDLNIGNPGDGLTVVSAMRRTQPEAVTLILTGYPAFETALEAIRQQVDDYLVKPADIPTLVKTIESKLATPPRQRQLPPPKRIAMLLREQAKRIEELWLSSAQTDHALSQGHATRQQRLDFLRDLLEEVIREAQSYTGEEIPEAKCPLASSKGDWKGHTPMMMLAEFCLLRRVIAQVVQENLLTVNLSHVVPDLARVNECLDQHAQAALLMLSEQFDAH